MTGIRICSPCELQHGASYVAASFGERFKPLAYLNLYKELITEKQKFGKTVSRYDIGAVASPLGNYQKNLICSGFHDFGRQSRVYVWKYPPMRSFKEARLEETYDEMENDVSINGKSIKFSKRNDDRKNVFKVSPMNKITASKTKHPSPKQHHLTDSQFSHTSDFENSEGQGKVYVWKYPPMTPLKETRLEETYGEMENDVSTSEKSIKLSKRNDDKKDAFTVSPMNTVTASNTENTIPKQYNLTDSKFSDTGDLEKSEGYSDSDKNLDDSQTYPPNQQTTESTINDESTVNVECLCKISSDDNVKPNLKVKCDCSVSTSFRSLKDFASMTYEEKGISTVEDVSVQCICVKNSLHSTSTSMPHLVKEDFEISGEDYSAPDSWQQDEEITVIIEESLEEDEEIVPIFEDKISVPEINFKCQRTSLTKVDEIQKEPCVNDCCLHCRCYVNAKSIALSCTDLVSEGIVKISEENSNKMCLSEGDTNSNKLNRAENKFESKVSIITEKNEDVRVPSSKIIDKERII